jgi:RNA polymerase sigma-70 factor (ECF subfamily)
MQPLSFEDVVSSFYESLYRFALTLAGQPGDASDLTQETFYVWATKGGQLRDKSKVKAWLFTTLYRQHINSRRRQSRFPHHELTAADSQLPSIAPTIVEQMDSATLLDAVVQIDEHYRAPLTLFYLEEHSYAEIAGILDIPIGTVMSRLSRGKAILRQLLADPTLQADRKITPFQIDSIRKKNA